MNTKPKDIDWYVALLTLVDKRGYIVNLEKDSKNREVWFMANDKKFLYRAWMLSDDKWVQGIYIKVNDELEALTDTEVKGLYDDLNTLDDIYV